MVSSFKFSLVLISLRQNSEEALFSSLLRFFPPTVTMSIPSLLDSSRQSTISHLDEIIPDEKVLDLENDSDFQEGGIRGWSIVLGA